jgi:hypothetical protein
MQKCAWRIPLSAHITMARYSRLESAEEKRNLRSAAILATLTIAVIALIVFFGIPLAGRVASFISGLRGDSAILSKDKTPPAPPTFRSHPDFTNQTNINLSGNAEPGATVKLTFNDKDQEVLTDKEGNFIFQGLPLKPGENKFTAAVIDTAGNVSQISPEQVIVEDTTNPELTIDSPAEGTNFFGNTQRQINIQGTTEASASATINDRVVSLDASGKFNYPVTLNNGENVFVIKAIDAASNQSEKNITLNFSE